MLFQEGPAQTFGYMVLGYAVILGTMGLFIASLIVRTRNLKLDLKALDEWEKDKAGKPSGSRSSK
jgi:hypothetical protein